MLSSGIRVLHTCVTIENKSICFYYQTLVKHQSYRSLNLHSYNVHMHADRHTHMSDRSREAEKPKSYNTILKQKKTKGIK